MSSIGHARKCAWSTGAATVSAMALCAALGATGALAQTKTVTGTSTAQFNLRTTGTGSGYVVSTTGAAPFTTIIFNASNNVAASAVVDGGGTPALTLTNNGSIISTGGAGVFLSSTAGGTVNNSNSITGSSQGILINGGVGAVTNSGTISSAAIGVSLGAATGGSITNNAGATITGANTAGAQISNGTIVNFGTISGTGASAVGARVLSGTTSTLIDNRTGGTITGLAQAVRIDGDGSVANSGTIRGTSTTANQGIGVFFSTRGGIVTNNAGGQIIGATTAGIQVAAAATGAATIDNSGSVTGGAIGINLASASGGTVNNIGSSSVITGSTAQGASILNGTATVTNDGSITGATAGVQIKDGSVTNNGTGSITAVNQAVRIDGVGSVTNSGSIHGTSAAATLGVGVFFSGSGGTVTNNAGGTIRGDGASGVFASLANGAGTSTVTNAGSISGAFNGVQYGSVGGGGGGGTVANSGTIRGDTGTGVAVFGPSTGAIQNNTGGQIIGAQNGVQLGSAPAGTPIGGGGTVVNSGTITGANTVGVIVFSGTASVTNNASATISGGANGVQYGPAVTSGLVDNSGTIVATTSSGVALQNGGTVLNRSGGLIETSGTAASGNRHGVVIEGAPGTVTNSGTITSATANGVDLVNGGTVTNADADARIHGGLAGVFLPNGGLVDNQQGTIESAGAGIVGSNGARVQSTAIINGGIDAVRFETGVNALELLDQSITTGNVLMGVGVDTTTVHAGANIDGVGLFDGNNQESTLTFTGYVGNANAIQRWKLVESHNGAAVTFDGNDAHQALTFDIDDSSAIAFSTQSGELTGDVVNAGLLDYRVGSGAATYNITGTLTNSALVELAGTPGIAGNTLTVANYVGQAGRIHLNTFLDTDGSASDRLIIDGGRATGDTALLISNTTGGGALTVHDGIMVVQSINGASTTSDAFRQGNRVAAGAFEYTLFYGGRAETGGNPNDQNWYLRNSITPPPPPAPPGPPPPPAPPSPPIPDYRVEVPADMVLPVLAQRMGLGMIGTYRDRVGEDYPDPMAPAEPVFCKDPAQNYRCIPTAEQAGVYAGATPRKMAAWGRIFGETGERDFGSDDLVGSLNAFLDNGPSYDIHVWGLQAGMDLWRKQHEDGSRDIGGFYLGYGRATADVNGVYGGDAGSAEMNAYALGGYWTHIGAPGWYVDAVLQGTRYDQADTTSVLGESFDTEGWGIAASLEGGYPFALGYGWTIEPQAQLVYQHVTLDDGADSFGLIGFDDSDALYGRLGGRLARNWMTQNNRHMTAWLSANVWSSFGADATTTFAGLSGANVVALDADLGGTWGSFGLGLSAEVADNVRLFASGDYNIGFDDGDSWSVGGRVGLKVVW